MLFLLLKKLKQKMIKDIIRKVLTTLHLDLTKNLKYDRLTKQIIKKALQSDSNTIDIGCHKGEILDLFLKFAPQGTSYCFEPIPVLYNDLVLKYKNNCKLYSCALSDTETVTTFNYVKNAPAYSGLLKRKYAIDNPDIELIEVNVKMLDSIIPVDTKIDLIKIDVEGAEFGVLKGAKQTIIKNKPIIIFECGLGASEFYNTKPEEVFQFINEIGLKLSVLENWLHKKKPLTLDDFCNLYHTNKEYYFIAYP